MIQIVVVTHKEYTFPTDKAYVPIRVGNKPENYQGCTDDTADNIAQLNSSFCELTALYWLWKNSQAGIIGLMHYRRYFRAAHKSLIVKKEKIAHSQDFQPGLNKNTIFVAKPRNYFITTIKKHYCRAHYSSDFDLLRQEILERYPKYIESFDRVMNRSYLSLYNMFVAPRTVIEPYFEWLFTILFALEKKIPYQGYDNYQKRVFGFMAERLFNVWLEKNKDQLTIEYRRVVNLEGENLFKKGIQFLKRNFLSRS